MFEKYEHIHNYPITIVVIHLSSKDDGVVLVGFDAASLRVAIEV